ncbi:beta-N-acetylhexosaminidase [Phycicoccus badiiscoriae]|uniref:beta-N-acetylhexosaminidase n=1 Tax=Pedococcus badiiscoriae TaxID=642776 RepID=A0A852WQZ1_9MICO|nr:glycoside hydrolase family 3 N-terminal domain-containing protein [Pedococcus badiiscoriae]NYG08625.1 beta-N-acetylhexosaminidase [Pedococcus badiiscoriae]
MRRALPTGAVSVLGGALAIALVAGVTTTVTTTAAAGAAATPDSLARAAFTRMTEVQRIGQLFMVGTPATGLTAGAASAITSRHVGNLILTGRTYAGAAPVRYLAASADRLTTAGATAGVPLYVAADQEGGQVQVLQGPGFSRMPTALTQGSWTDTTLTADARIWGRQLTRAGVDLNLAPVVDTVPASLGTRNIPIGHYFREYGYTPAVVAAKGSDVVRGERSVGLAVTAKHFPGLGHVTANTDTTGGVTDSVTTRTSGDLAPFRSAIAAGARVVMVSLAAYSKIDPARPAAFSPTVVTGMLRTDLGFTGVVMSDDLGNARQVAAWSPGARATSFIAVGGDIVLTVNSSVLPAMVDAVSARAASDPAFRAKVDAAAYRVLLAKAADGMLAPRVVTDGVLRTATVSALQRWLGVTVTGTFGATTVRALQARVGTPADGQWGPQSLAAMQAYLGIGRDVARTWNTRTVSALQAYLTTQL